MLTYHDPLLSSAPTQRAFLKCDARIRAPHAETWRAGTPAGSRLAGFTSIVEAKSDASLGAAGRDETRPAHAANRDGGRR